MQKDTDKIVIPGRLFGELRLNTDPTPKKRKPQPRPTPGEKQLLADMQQHLLTHLPKEWDALHPEEHQQHPTLWEQLLGMADGGKDYGVDESQYAAVALEAIATTYGLELALSNRDHAGIRTIAELVGVPYHLLLQKYITKYGDKNNGKHYEIREQETAGTADAGR